MDRQIMWKQYTPHEYTNAVCQVYNEGYDEVYLWENNGHFYTD